jgi:hypothetical protein
MELKDEVIENHSANFAAKKLENLKAHQIPKNKAIILTACIIKPLKMPHIANPKMVAKIIVSNKLALIKIKFFQK